MYRERICFQLFTQFPQRLMNLIILKKIDMEMRDLSSFSPNDKLSHRNHGDA